MRITETRADVVVIGASVAGCTAARLLALDGARVALVERRPQLDAHKVACTHAILSPANSAIERLGLAPLLMERGAVRTQFRFWTPYGGWFDFPADLPDGWGVTRQTLDPLLRELTADTPGVELFNGWRLDGVVHSGGRPAGVEITQRGTKRHRISAPLVIGADGRSSATAQMAGVPGRRRPHNRFFYFAYWRGVEPADNRARLWMLDRDAAAQFPNEDGLSLLVTTFHRSRLDEVRADVEGAYTRAVEQLPDGPRLENAERVSAIAGKIDVPNVIRPAARPGVAFAGDAAVACDPLFGTGIAFAFESAEWLADALRGNLGSAAAIDRALARYRRRHLRRLGPHHLVMSDFASGRPPRWFERQAFRGSVSRPVVNRAFAEVMARERGPLHLMRPRVAAALALTRSA